MNYRDYYQILGVNKTADKNEIKRAYRKLAMQYHPDQNPNNSEAEEKFKEINEAYQVLSDPDKRAHYDRLGADYQSYQQGGGRPGGFNWGQYTQPGAGGVHVDYQDLFGGDFSDFFSQIFGGMGGTRQSPGSTRRANPKYETEMIVSLSEAFTGSTRKISINNRSFDVKIPKGAQNGTKLRLRGAGPNDGDVYLVLKLSPDPRFDYSAGKLSTELKVDLYTAVLGGELKVPTLSGFIMLTIPAGTQPGQVFRIKGRGMPSLKSPEQVGDLYATASIEIPKKLTANEKKLFQQLKDLQ